MGIARELQEAVGNDDSFTNEDMEEFLRDHPALIGYGAEDPGALERAMDTLERLHAEGVGDDMMLRIGASKEFMRLVAEGASIPSALRILDEAGKFGQGNPGNDPFKTEPLHATNSAGIGGGRPNPRTRTGECDSCSCENYVCTCDCTHPETGKKYTKTVDMTSYKNKKKRYMKHWRQNHGKVHPNP